MLLTGASGLLGTWLRTTAPAGTAVGVGAAVLHVSTDAVFSGDGTGRDEHAVPDPVHDYGRWKAQAEHLVTSGSPDAAVPSAVRPRHLHLSHERATRALGWSPSPVLRS